jgi:hypothetical protein
VHNWGLQIKAKYGILPQPLWKEAAYGRATRKKKIVERLNLSLGGNEVVKEADKRAKRPSRKQNARYNNGDNAIRL